MTCRMVAGKQNKRLISSNNSEQYRSGKKTKSQSSNCLVSLKPHISLKWDQYRKRIVAEKEQIGILWSDLAPFIESPKHCSGLADVTYVPPETFSFENLRAVLSQEVWTTCLTEAERKFLIQFLPSEVDAEECIRLLLKGDSHHFESPLLSWSSSLCYGDIHPDALLKKEKHIKKQEKAYHNDLHNYHSNIVETLRKWRKRWLSCGDTENLFSANPAKEKQGVVQVPSYKSGMPLKVAQSVDISKFMSYIEISTTQLNHIKRLKQSGDGIQTKHVSRVIGGLDKSRVKPYGVLIEGEQRRQREHWLNMVHNDLPAFLEVLKDSKTLMKESRKLLVLEIGEKNVSVLRKADQLSDISQELGQHGVCKNDGSPTLLNGQVEHSPQSMSQGGNDQSTSLQDQDDEEINYMETAVYHMDSPNVKGHHFIVAKDTHITSKSEKSSAQDQDCNYASCIDENMSCANPDEQNKHLADKKLSTNVLDVQCEGINEVGYKDMIHINHTSQSQQIKSNNYTSKLVQTLDSQNLQVEDLDGIAYTGPPVHAHEQGQDLKSISGTIANHRSHDVNVPSEKSHEENTFVPDHEEAENVMMIPSNCSKSSGEHTLMEDFMDPNEVAKGEPGSLQSYYHPSQNRMYNGPYDMQIRQLSSFYVDNGALGQQLPQVSTSILPVDNSASSVEPFLNTRSNGRHQIADIGNISYPLERVNSIQRSTGLHALANNHLARSCQLPRPLQAQQLIDRSHEGFHMQLHNNLSSGVSFPTNGNSAIVEQQSYPALAPMDHRYNWFLEGNEVHNNNFPGLVPDNCMTQGMPSGSNTDGSLLSVIAPYKQPSVHMQPGRLSSNELLEPRNQVRPPQNFLPRTQDPVPPFADIYGYRQNMSSGSSSSNVASLGSLNNMHWTNIIQQNPGMTDFTTQQFQGPWTR